MGERLMATTDLTGLSAEFSSAPGHGMGDTTAVAAGGLVATTVVAITDAEAMATLAAPTDA